MNCNSNTHRFLVPSFVARRDSSCRTQIDLLKPSERAEWCFDTLDHYQASSNQTTGAIPTTVGRRVAEYPSEYIFRCLMEFRSQLCGRAHMRADTKLVVPGTDLFLKIDLFGESPRIVSGCLQSPQKVAVTSLLTFLTCFRTLWPMASPRTIFLDLSRSKHLREVIGPNYPG